MRAYDFRFERMLAPDGTLEFWKGDQPGFGVFVQEFDGYLYLWGCIQPGTTSAGDMHLARVRPDDIEDLAAYEYLIEAPTIDRPEVRSRWSSVFVPSVPLFDHVPKADSLFNAGKEHPEFARQGGKVLYMTYVDSSVYAPHLVEITLA